MIDTDGESPAPTHRDTDSEVDGQDGANRRPMEFDGECAEQGSLTCFLVVASPGKWWSKLFRRAEIDSMGGTITAKRVVGAVLGYWQALKEIPPGEYHPDELRMLQSAVRRGRGRRLFLLSYIAFERFSFDDVSDYDGEDSHQLFHKILHNRGVEGYGDGGEQETFSAVHQRWREELNNGRTLPVVIVEMGLHMSLLAVSKVDFFHATVLGWKLSRNQVIGDSPSEWQVR